MKIKYKPFDPLKNYFIPVYKTSGSAGLDLAASLDSPVNILPGTSSLIGTNLIIELPEGYEGQVRSRSGLAHKHSVMVLNSPGTIDSDYRGEVKVLLFNHGRNEFTVNNGDRIAQLIIAKFEHVELIINDELTKTERNTGGYGSTGI